MQGEEAKGHTPPSLFKPLTCQLHLEAMAIHLHSSRFPLVSFFWPFPSSCACPLLQQKGRPLLYAQQKGWSGFKVHAEIRLAAFCGLTGWQPQGSKSKKGIRRLVFLLSQYSQGGLSERTELPAGLAVPPRLPSVCGYGEPAPACVRLSRWSCVRGTSRAGAGPLLFPGLGEAGEFSCPAQEDVPQSPCTLNLAPKIPPALPGEGEEWPVGRTAASYPPAPSRSCSAPRRTHVRQPSVHATWRVLGTAAGVLAWWDCSHHHQVFIPNAILLFPITTFPFPSIPLWSFPSRVSSLLHKQGRARGRGTRGVGLPVTFWASQ